MRDESKVKRLVADLDSERFVVRDRAEKELAQLGDRAKSALEQALSRGPDLEVRQRITRLLARCAETAVPAPDQLRLLRAVEVLEGIGSAEARRILATLAGGAEGARLTREAVAAVRRLERRAGPRN